MSPTAIPKDDPIPPDRLAEAGVWIARLHGDDRDLAMESGFRQWLTADPMNARAFELSTEVWEESRNLRRVVPFAHEASPGRRRLFQLALPAMVVMVAIAAAIVIVGEIFYFQRAGVSTGVGEQRLLTLQDGSRVFLNTATRVVVEYDRGIRRVELKGGEALFDVAPRSNRPFVVQAGDRQVRALGTSFVVRYEEDRTAVTLVEGKVAISERGASARERINSSASPVNLPGDSITLSPGQRLTLATHKPAQIDRPSLDKAMAWRRGQVVLDDTPLHSAVNEMNRYNAVKLAIERPEAADLLVNGLFQAGDSMSFANAVAQTYGLHVLEQRDEILLEGLPKAVVHR